MASASSPARPPRARGGWSSAPAWRSCWPISRLRDRRWQKAREILGTASQVRADAERLSADSRRAAQRAVETLDIRRKALADAERRRSQLAERLSAHNAALSRIDAEMETFRGELRAAQDALEGISDTSALERRRDDVQAELAKDRGRAAEARLDAERAAHEETMRMRRIGDIATERARWTSRIRKAEEHIAELKVRLSALDTEIAAVPDDPALFEERRKALETDVAAAEAGVASAIEELTQR